MDVPLECELLPEKAETAMKTKEIDQTKVDAAAEAAPRGMAPDKAHARLKSTGAEPDVEVEETFDNSPNNSSSVGNRRLK
jgi:hypothetical protein